MAPAHVLEKERNTGAGSCAWVQVPVSLHPASELAGDAPQAALSQGGGSTPQRGGRRAVPSARALGPPLRAAEPRSGPLAGRVNYSTLLSAERLLRLLLPWPPAPHLLGKTLP